MSLCFLSINSNSTRTIYGYSPSAIVYALVDAWHRVALTLLNCRKKSKFRTNVYTDFC